MDKQRNLYENDGATYLLNSYCTYKVSKGLTKYHYSNYMKHDCVKEYKSWAKKRGE